MINEIKQGDTVKCLYFGKPILLNEETFVFDSEAEYIYCPSCEQKIDTHYYHTMGEKIVE